ncbi:unnamed protein product [Dibothriocephalus latus]|uniref:Ferritin n=1 Tax=Dibothriocephalus latus TaxID=60516 RepID=A0A3P6QF54_DIBLA|nr:unnamed protein product [Dibothriocephalus latus]
MLVSELEMQLNDQITLEYEAFYVYEKMAAHFARADKALFGFAAFFRHAADEEKEHAREFTQFINQRFGTLPLDMPTSWSSPVEALKAALQREADVYNSILYAYKSAERLQDFHMQEFLEHFTKEQASALFKLKSLITRLEGKGPAVEYLIDRELAEKPSMH